MADAQARWPVGRAKPETVGLSSRRLKLIDDLMEEAVATGVTPGVITVVCRRGKIAHLRLAGYRDLEHRLPMTEDCIFRIHSMSKIVTSVATLILLEEGRIFLTEPVSKYIPEFKNLRVAVEKGRRVSPAGDVTIHNLHARGGRIAVSRTEPLRREVTIHDLLTHLSGLSYEFLDRKQFADMPLKTFVKEICTFPLKYQPGTVWHYGASTDVLGGLIEIVSGMPFDVFLEERIFRPLGMTDTSFFVPPEKAGRFVKMYTPGEKGRFVPAEFPPYRNYFKPSPFKSGGGGLVSTTSDYLRFALMLLNKGELNGVRVLSRKTVELMCEDHLPPGHPPLEVNHRGFGLGVSVVRRLGETKMLCSVGEFGWGGAAGTQVWIDPAEEMVCLIMQQIRPKEGFRLLNQFRNLACQAIAD